jgi:DNA-binding response OmpR family regulator
VRARPRTIRGVSEIAVVEDDDSWRHEYHEEPAPPTLAVVVYSDDRTVRQQIRLALGKRPAKDLPALEYTEVATPAALIQTVDKGSFDLLILDGEAVPAGGMGLCRQLKDEIYRCPPILVIIGRPQDAWLATWSRADGVIGHPIDAIATAKTVADLLRTRVDA